MYEHAISTVAMSIYNLLAAEGPVLSKNRILAELETRQLPGLKKSALHNALNELKKRGLVLATRKGFKIVDPQRRLAIERNRDGDGWDGWKVRDIHRGLLPIE